MKFIQAVSFCLFSMIVHGQDSGFRVGFESGAGMSSLVNPRSLGPAPTTASLFATTFGAYLQYDISPVFSLRTGAYYERKGYQFELIFTDLNGETLGNLDVREKFQYVNIPLLLRAGMGEGRNFSSIV